MRYLCDKKDIACDIACDIPMMRYLFLSHAISHLSRIQMISMCIMIVFKVINEFIITGSMFKFQMPAARAAGPGAAAAACPQARLRRRLAAGRGRRGVGVDGNSRLKRPRSLCGLDHDHLRNVG